jgi:chromosome segregation ATPase
MLYLAKVKKKEFAGKAMLQLLAQQRSDHYWSLSSDEGSILAADVDDLEEGNLVLLQLTEAREVQSIRDATSWVLELVENYLANGVTPELLQNEAERVEQWRQSLTLQSQEVARRALEIEARRDQIQDLENNLKQEQKQLEITATELEARHTSLQEMEHRLQEERHQLESLAIRLKANVNGSSN